jgi:Amt family ammonium transporter
MREEVRVFDLASGPGWLSPGDTGWQLTAATFVGLQSVPGLAILYAGVMKRKWAVNSSLMVLYAFGATLVVWTLFAYSMAFGKPAGIGPGLVGIPWPILDHAQLEGRAQIPLLTGLIPTLKFPGAAMIFFQFVFAAITIIILAGGVLGRMSFKAWMLFAPLWITVVYTVGAFLLWGGGWLAQQGAVDYSGGYVIHVAAGVSGFVAAAVVGPRLLKDRQENNPSNVIMAVAGGGLLWLGWNGFNGGDPYFANADAAAAVLNTNLCTGCAMLAWMFLDVFVNGKATVGGMINGMIAGLVAITPAAGFVSGFGALGIGVAAGAVVWFTWHKVGPRTVLSRVDDTLGVLHTHAFAGALGGLLTGLLADPNMIVYPGTGKSASFSVTGLIYGNPHQLWVQFFSLVILVVWDVVATFVVIKVVGFIVPLRMPESVLEVGDQAVHGNVAFDLLPLPHESPT